MELKATLTAIGVAVAVALGACSADADATLKSLPLSDHVVTKSDNFKLTEKPTVQSVDEFAAAHEHNASELQERGLVRGTTAEFAPKDEDFFGHALSVAEEFETAEQAQAEADRLFASNSEPPPGATVRPLEIGGIPGVQAVAITGDFEGTSAAGVEIVFVDGNVLHEIFAMGAESLINVDDFVAAAEALYASIADHAVK